MSFKEPEDLVRDLQKEFKLSFTVLFDVQGKVSENYEMTGHPVTFLVMVRLRRDLKTLLRTGE